jgi:glutathione synthase/RimK-type ligase-like ATP-grasp enzyme
MSIAILYDHPETDEMGIRLTARELGINLVYVPFHKISICISSGQYSVRDKRKSYFGGKEDAKVVLNRAQSKNRRLFAANILEEFGKHVINSSNIEFLCFSKLRTLLHLWKKGIEIPRTVYVPCDSHELKADGNQIHNEEDIADLILQGLGSENIVVKPDAGTHGNQVKLAKERSDLLMILRETMPSIINPVGILAQEFIPKWFYDLRIVVAKERGKTAHCYPKALARTGFRDLRTNTYLGNMAFGVDLPGHIRETAVKCGEALSENSDAWVLALDAMLNVGEDRIVDDESVKSELDKLVPDFDSIQKVKNSGDKGKFAEWNRKLEDAFQNYVNSEPYENVKSVIEESIRRKKNSVLFHEANSCPDFWEWTRLVAGINLAIPLLRCAQSVIRSS